MRLMVLLFFAVGCSSTPPKYRLVPTGGQTTVTACEKQKKEVEQWNLRHPDKPKRVLC